MRKIFVTALLAGFPNFLLAQDVSMDRAIDCSVELELYHGAAVNLRNIGEDISFEDIEVIRKLADQTKVKTTILAAIEVEKNPTYSAEKFKEETDRALALKVQGVKSLFETRGTTRAFEIMSDRAGECLEIFVPIDTTQLMEKLASEQE